MELSKIYEQLHGNYEAVLKRMHTEQRIEKYLLRFLDKHFDTLILEALETKDYEQAFCESHNLKGVCASLSLDQLGESASALSEILRNGEPQEDISFLVKTMCADYKMTMDALKILK